MMLSSALSQGHREYLELNDCGDCLVLPELPVQQAQRDRQELPAQLGQLVLRGQRVRQEPQAQRGRQGWQEPQVLPEEPEPQVRLVRQARQVLREQQGLTELTE